ncbi:MULTISPECIES: IS66-like element accessory protein TnpA [Erwiniaceae]|uniref:Transposase n=2 Tax=Erwiniaceae TaxID=1903409 RepID=A0ACC5PQ55_ENTAG|nr:MULTISPECIES: IS66-like element accessory protein TnpA [Erwiniaceae]MBD8127115.1 transposase [Pantoea agglomerans]MBD8170376.1 transposase [Erwinia persicina]
MKHRTWLLEALRLHFEEKLPRIEAGQRLGIPKTTVCDLFVRFRQAGLSWPLPDGVNAKKLDKRLYRQASRKSPVPPRAPVPCAIPVARKRPRRPNFPRDFKIALVAQSMQPGVSVAQLARENNINDNLLFNWRRRYQQELSGTPASTPALIPVTLTATERPVSPLTPSAEESPCCELVLPAGTLRISGKLTPELLQMLIREMQGGCR